MKLESFKFQDGKVFWLPEYPDIPIKCVWDKMPPERCMIRLCECAKEEIMYSIAVTQSLASAIEVDTKGLVIERQEMHTNRTMQMIMVKQHPFIYEELREGKVYSAECEMEIKTVYEPLVSKFDLQFSKVPIGTQLLVAHQVARLKLV